MSRLPSAVTGLVSPSPLLLEVDLTQPLLAQPPTDPLSWLQARRRPTLRSVLDCLDLAARDEDVRGLVARVGGRMSLARAQELAEAVRRFRSAGKHAVAWAETFGELGPGTEPYVLATAFEEVWLQPSGSVGLLGTSARVMFVRGALDRLGVQPQLRQRHEYKSAADMLMRRDFSEAHREAADRLAESAYEQVVEAVAANRRLEPQSVRDLVDRAPLLAEEARAAGLVDRIGYRDEVYADVRRRVGQNSELRFLLRYSPRVTPSRLRERARRHRRVLALVSGTGAIRQGPSGFSPLTGHAMGSDTVAAALRTATRDDDVAGILFRVDSPGGSYVASDVVWREVVRAREDGKPVVVSMGEVAASGGYFVSVGADAIVALPGTLTGSIGVVAGKLVTGPALERAGLTLRTVSRGTHARMFSSAEGFDEDQAARLDAWLDTVYDDFVDRVARGRRLSPERVHELARGRVWTGTDARRHGLVDALGGLPTARSLLADRVGLPVDTPVRPYVRVTPLHQLRRPRSSEDVGAPTWAGAGGTMDTSAWGPFRGIADVLGLPGEGPLLAALPWQDTDPRG